MRTNIDRKTTSASVRPLPRAPNDAEHGPLSQAGRSVIALLAITGVVVIIAAGLWALLRKSPRPENEAMEIRTSSALRPKTSAKAPPADRGSVAPVKPTQAAVAVESAPPRTPERRWREKAAGNPYTTHSELLTWIKATDTIADYGKKKLVLVDLGRELAAENFENALLLAGGISDSTTRNWVYEGIFALQAATNPTAALRAAQALNPENSTQAAASRYGDLRQDYYTALLAVMGGWAAVDPTAALEYVAQVPTDIAGKAMISVYGVWAEKDPSAALARAGEIAEGIRAPVFYAIFSGWAKQDPAAATRYAATIDDASILPKIYGGIAEGFLSTWDQHEPRSMADWAVEVFPKEVLDYLLPGMYVRWAQSDPMSAAQHALQLNRSYAIDMKSTLGNILKQWSESDLDGAVSWIDQTFPSDQDYVWAVSTLLDTMRYKDPARTAELLERVPFTYADDTSGAAEVAKLMAFWCRKDANSAVAWAENIEDRSLRIIAIKTLAANWASQQYDQALSWAEGISDPDMKAYALSNVALRQALHNMKKPDEWIRELPEGFVRVRTAAGFVLGAMLHAKDDASATLVKQQLSADALDVGRLNQIVRDSALDAESRDRLLGLLN